MKVVINVRYGGFGLSSEAIKEYLRLKDKECFFYEQTKYEHRDGVVEYKKVTSNDDSAFFSVVTKDLGETTKKLPDKYYFMAHDIKRNDEDLIKVVEKLGEKANGQFAELKIVEIPDDIEWSIEEYDGTEWIAEKHKTWS